MVNSPSYDLFKSFCVFFFFFFLQRREDRNLPLEARCHSRTISAVCHWQGGRRGRDKRQDMDSTFICKQGSLNRGHFTIALKFTGAKEACLPPPQGVPGWVAPGFARWWEENHHTLS